MAWLTGGLSAGDQERHFAVIGDSTFFHTGIPALMNVAYNRSNIITIILDNRTTGMTGHQQNPGTISRSANAIERMQDAQKIMTECIHNYSHLATVCIEGASFADKYRQVELAEMRASIAWWGLNKKFRIEILPPNSIRK